MAVVDPMRVAVIDDDLWVRTGRATALAEAGLQVVAACDHAAALALGDAWDQVDAAVVDAWDGREAWDRFPGVAVVEAIRRRRAPAQTLIVVISGHVLSDVLRLRMAEAGADFFYGHEEVRELDDLLAVIRSPEQARRVEVVDTGELQALGLSRSSRPNAALADITRRGLTGAFAPGTSQKALPAGRRTLITARRRLSEIAGLAPSGRPTAGRVPEWRQVVRFVNRARGVSEDE